MKTEPTAAERAAALVEAVFQHGYTAGQRRHLSQQIAATIREAEAAAFRRGFEAGRKASESACDAEEGRPSCDWQDGPAAQVYCQQAARGIKRRIAALPVPEDRP